MKKLTIALLGNTNNYPLLLAEGFLKLGHHVRLLVNRKELLHRPESKRPEWQAGYPDWIRDVSALDDLAIAYESPMIDGVVSQLTDGVDLAILNDIGPSFARYLRCPHVSFLTGSDLSYYADYGSVERRTENWDPAFRRSFEGRRITRKLSELVICQRDGILSSDAVSFAAKGLSREGDRLLQSIGVTESQRIMIHMSVTLTLPPKPARVNESLRVLNGSRVLWQQTPDNRYMDMDLKGTDVLLEGFARYCRKGGRGTLHLFRKGSDIGAAERMIKSLDIENRIVWLPEMTLNQFYDEIGKADLVCDQFARSFPGMVSLDSYALGRPVMANFRNDIFSGYFPEPLPGLQADNPDEVCRHLIEAEADRNLLATMGKASRKYADTYLAPDKMAGMILRTCGFE